MYRKTIRALLCAAMLLLLCACGAGTSAQEPQELENIALTLWAYPVGQWSEGNAAAALIQSFNDRHDDRELSASVLDENGSVVISAAVEAAQAPDLLLGSVAQLRSAARSGAKLADLSELWDLDTYLSVKASCTDGDGRIFVRPLAMDVTAMAINYEMFRDAGALQYIDEARRTWTTEGFAAAVRALHGAQLCPDAAAIYCGGQNGDQGTRALVANLYGGRLYDETHRRYTLDDEANLAALALLQSLDGVAFDPAITGQDENQLFAQQQLAMTFCWDSAQEAPEGFTAFPMAYPSESGVAALPGEVWGFAVVDNGDEARLAAALTFVRELTEDPTSYRIAVRASGHRSVYRSAGTGEVWDDFAARMGLCDVYMPGWAVARTEWWQLLQRIGAGGDVALETDTFCANANAAAAAGS